MTEALERDGARFGDRYFQIRYEDLCARPVETVREVTDRCGWSWSGGFEETISRDHRSANGRWKRSLSPENIEEIRSEAPELFDRFTERE